MFPVANSVGRREVQLEPCCARQPAKKCLWVWAFGVCLSVPNLRKKTNWLKVVNREKQIKKPSFSNRNKGFLVKMGGYRWWRRGESNPCPKASPHGFLRAQSVICISQFRRPPTGSGSAIPEKSPYQPSGSQALRYLALRRPDPLPREGRGLNVSRLSC